MTAPWPIQVEQWMRERGTLDDGVPRKPMTEQTVTNRMKVIRRVASDLGFLSDGARPLRDLRPRFLVDYIGRRFPDGGYEDRNNWNNHARALRTLAVYLHHEVRGSKGRPAWSARDVERFMSSVKVRTERRTRPPTLSEEFLRRWENFLEYVRDLDPCNYAFAAWSYHTCMRYDEVRRMDVGLRTGSAILQADGTLEVDGKRNKGEPAPRTVPVRAEAREVMSWWMDYRERAGLTATALFPAGQTGTRRSVSSSTYNRRLRLLARDSGLFDGTCNDRGDRPTGELRLIRSHTMGRHAGATALGHSEAALIDIQRQTGHRDPKILDRYINVDAGSVSERLQAHRSAWKGEGFPYDQDRDVDGLALVNGVLAGLSLEDKKAVLRDLVSELTA